jgi:O-antigen ligase
LEVTEHTRLARPVLGAPPEWSRPTVAGLRDRVSELLLPSATLGIVFVAVLVAASLNQHPFTDIRLGLPAQALRSIVPLLAASVATLAIRRPWPAFLAVVALTPAWNATQTQFQVGPIQVILQTIFVAALIAGCVFSSKSRRRVNAPMTPNGQASGSLGVEARSSLRGLTARYTSHRFAQVAVAGFVGLAVLSTIASRDVVASSSVLLHGIVEPIALAAILVWLRPSRRDLVIVSAALGASIALGSLMSIVQMLPDHLSLGSMQAHRLKFSRLPYFNVGLFGVIVAMVVPLLIGALATRRSLRFSRAVTIVLAAALLLTLSGLFFSFSKSAWLATASGAGIVVLLLAPTWRRRLAMMLATAAVSAALVPWPALVLQMAPPADATYRTAMVSLVGQARFDSWNPATTAGRGSLSERFYAVDGGIRMAIDHPVLGVGLNQYRTYYISFGYRSEVAKVRSDHAHSLFPEVAAELGYPAMVLLAIAFSAALWAMWRAYRAAADRLTRTLAATLFASLGAWLMAATAFGCDIYRPGRALASDVMAAAIVMAMAISLARLLSSETEARHPRTQTPAV